MIGVLYDDQIFRMQKYGGISRYFSEIADHLANSGLVSVRIFAPLYCNEYIHARTAVRPMGIKIPKSRFTVRMAGYINGALSRATARRHNDFDICHETYYSASRECPASAKRIITVFDMIHEKFESDFSARDKTRYEKAAAVRRADHIICISESTRNDLVELLDVPVTKTSVVYLGHSFLASEAARSYRQRRPYILYVGARHGYKNFEMLLRAYSSSKYLTDAFSILCFGGGRLTTRELEVMAQLKLPANSVSQLGGGDSTLAALYASAAVLVYPSLYEGFGIPPLEAMALGCPVACSNTSSIPEVVGDAAELFCPANPEDMREAIERVVSSPTYSSLLVAKGRERVKKFSWEKCARDTLAVYHKVLQG